MHGGFSVVPGSEKDAYERNVKRREYLLQIGSAGLTIYLNGGSDTRRATREYWAEFARSRNIAFYGCGSHCVVGGRP